MFDSVIMVDWSGGNDRGARPARDAIWSAKPGQPPRYHRNRDAVAAYLADSIARALADGGRLFAGFDFPFGYPRGFAERLTGRADPLAVWAWYADRLEDSPQGNNRFELAGRINGLFPGTGPFWFNATRREIPDLPRLGRDRCGHGMPERRQVEERARGSFTCWQMGGAGAVGSQAMTGMATLEKLRRAFPGQIAVWPFEPLDRPVAFVEVWPSLVDGAVRRATRPCDIRDAVQVRVLADAVARMSEMGTLASALDAAPRESAEEGWILGVGALDALDAAVR